MFEKLPVVLSADDLLDRAFRRTKKVQITDRDPYYREKKTIIAKTESFSDSIISTLEQYVKQFPSIGQLPLFYQEIIDIKINVDKLKKSLGAANWAYKTCRMIYTTQIKGLKKSKDINFLKQKQNEIQGRISSVVKQIDKELAVLAEAQNIMKNLPEIHDVPTVVIAGYPNVGKSSLLRCLSSAKPQVAQYPFTTKEIYVGHIKKTERYIDKSFQIIDTPGLLDRPFSEMKNSIEKQAVAALTHLADIIVFLIDPTETCGYSLKDQQSLLSHMKEMFNDSVFIVVENKADFKKTKSNNLKISCESKEGIDKLIEQIFSNYKSN